MCRKVNIVLQFGHALHIVYHDNYSSPEIWDTNVVFKSQMFTASSTPARDEGYYRTRTRPVSIICLAFLLRSPDVKSQPPKPAVLVSYSTWSYNTSGRGVVYAFVLILRPLRLGLHFKLVHVEFVVEEVALGRGFPTVLPFFLPVVHIQMFFTNDRRNFFVAIDTVVK
jgi:hypothetical protein